jgi:hypothetical protein
MLGVSNAAKLSAGAWADLPSRVVLPETVLASVRRESDDTRWADCSRQYPRRAFHKPVIIIDGESSHACMTKDLSRKGLGFYAPLNYLPRKLLHVWLPNGEMLSVRVTRCRRLGERCYEVGASFCLSKQ